jgi:hypothetical protein
VSLCIAAAGVAVTLAASSFTLSWTHTVEKTRWEETWRIDADRLILTEAQIEGSGAGMEPPPDARLVAGAYLWAPNEARDKIVLRRYAGAGDWRLCAAGRCDELGGWLGSEADPVTPYAAGEQACRAELPG